MDKNFKVKVNEIFEYEFENSVVQTLDLLNLSPHNFHLIQNNKSFNIHVEKSDFDNKKYTIAVNDTTYHINISNPLDILIEKLGFAVDLSKKANDIKAPMPGLILNVLVKEGATVKEGETLLILEAMKMENTLVSHKSGVIKSIFIENGKTVNKGDLLIEFAS